jgi:hypothetical protein
MKSSSRRLMAALLAACALGACALGAANARAAGGPSSGEAASPAQVAAQRQEILDAMLTNKYDASWIAGLRRVCAVGQEPASVVEETRRGHVFHPGRGRQLCDGAGAHRERRPSDL